MDGEHPLGSVTFEAMVARGKESEERFFKAFTKGRWRKPSWYKSVRPATGLEDSEGYDFFINTDIGELPIQVKSSKKYVARYRRRHPESDAIIVVVGNLSRSRIRELTLHLIKRRRLRSPHRHKEPWRPSPD
jgi:hypothetical protein